MISKKLLQEVTGNYRIHTDGYIQEEENLIHYGCIYGNAPDDYYDEQECINMYELTHLCKTWAIEKGYTLVESPLMIRVTRLCTDKNKIFEYSMEEQDKEFYFKPEYTFKACEYILKKTT